MKYNFDFQKVHKKGCNGMGKWKRKPVVCVETGVRYSSAAEAARKNGLYRGNITLCLKGRLKTTGKLHWKYSDN